MKHILPLIVAVVCVVVIGGGLVFVLRQAVVVAPLADTAGEGRLLHHLKNVTCINGDADEVGRRVHRAVYLDTAGYTPAGADWRTTILRAVPSVERPPHVVALAGEGPGAEVWSLPGAYWAVYAGVPVVFVGSGAPGDDVLQTLRRYAVPVYVLAPAHLVPDRVVSQLNSVVRTERIAGSNPASHAVAVAEYRDNTTSFGWGRMHDNREGYFHFALAAPSESAHAYAALPLARSNAATFLFAGDDGGLPAATDRYCWSIRADFYVTPSEGPFRHFWVLGDRMSNAARGRLDLSVEKSPYPDKGSTALGPMEALFIVFIAFGIAGAIFVFLHGRRLLPEVMPSMLSAWSCTAMLVPVLGVLLYLAAYRRPVVHKGGMVHWQRPASVQSAAATAMGFGYGAPLMIVIGYLFLFFGFPLFYGEWADGWVFLVGAGMPLMMAAMYVGAVALAWPLVQLPMATMMNESTSGGNDVGAPVWRVLGVTALSMAAVSLGMMTTTWLMTMNKLPMMPKDDDIAWFGSIWLASTIGFLVAWPLNTPMIRAGLKHGEM